MQDALSLYFNSMSVNERHERSKDNKGKESFRTIIKHQSIKDFELPQPPGGQEFVKIDRSVQPGYNRPKQLTTPQDGKR